jgi:hypothetical protein
VLQKQERRIMMGQEQQKEVMEEVSVSSENTNHDYVNDMYTKEEWEAPVFENGPTRKEVEAWKEKYGQVYFTPFDDLIVIWRTLSRPEYREIIRNQELTMLDREEMIADKCVLFPYDFSCAKYTQNGMAGIPSLLSEMIMDKSGFVSKTGPIKL